jgi:[acyl-carrier-protein] S-malonyltransferase
MNNIALLFPGQGSQYIGMAKELYNRYSIAKEVFEEADETLGFRLSRLCFEGSMEDLTKTENTQPALLTSSVAAFSVYMNEVGIEPTCLAGHSLGEITALCCTGAIRFADAVKIVRRRGKFMQEAVAVGVGGMVAVNGVDHNIIEAECRKSSKDGQVVVVSNYNSPDQIVISGSTEALSDVINNLKRMDARIIPLKVSAPFHSPLMKPASEKLKEELLKYTYYDMKWPVISNLYSQPYPDRESIIEYLSLQLIQPVKWHGSMSYLNKLGVNTAIEIGPQVVLKNLMKKNYSHIKTFSFENEKDIQGVKVHLSKNDAVNEDINNMSIITKCIAEAVCSKNSNWDNDEYQKGVIESYKKMQVIKNELKDEGANPSIDQVKEVIAMLDVILKTKKIPDYERIESFRRIFEETGTEQLFLDFLSV